MMTSEGAIGSSGFSESRRSEILAYALHDLASSHYDCHEQLYPDMVELDYAGFKGLRHHRSIHYCRNRASGRSTVENSHSRLELVANLP